MLSLMLLLLLGLSGRQVGCSGVGCTAEIITFARSVRRLQAVRKQGTSNPSIQLMSG